MPLTVPEQAEDLLIRGQSLNVKFDTQLVEMRSSHAAKVIRVQENVDRFEDADGFRSAVWESLRDRGLTRANAVTEAISQRDFYQAKRDKLNEIVRLIRVEQGFRRDGKVTRTPIGTAFFIDSDNGNNSNDGLTTGAAFADLHKFTENARSAGDTATLRRGMTNRYDDGSDLLFTSDGQLQNPIIIKADNADAFSDDVDLSVTATATLTFGSKTITFSADVSSVVAAGDWIYVAAEDADEFAYEVDTVSTVTVTLFLPYKGAQAGSTKTMTNMQSPPIWNTAAGNFQWNFDTDQCWKVQGIHIRGADTGGGNVEVDSSNLLVFKDCIFEGNGAAGSPGLKPGDDAPTILVLKCRFINHEFNITGAGGNASFDLTAIDCLLDGNDVSNSVGLEALVFTRATFIDCEFKRHATADIDANDDVGAQHIRLRNCILSSTTEILVGTGFPDFARVFIEDNDGTIGDTRQIGTLGNSSSAFLQSDTGTTRSGGGAISGKVTPSTLLGTKWEQSRILLFEIPFYATTSSKKYEVFFRPTATADWTADPLAGELWIELEYWGHATNNFRRITKSTGVIDMNGSTTFTALSVTIAPSQTGVAYLRGYYAKTKESSKANTFFFDIVPVVTDG